MSRVVVVAPGRGTYNRSELGYLGRFSDAAGFSNRAKISQIADRYRKAKQRVVVSELDEAEHFQSQLHLPGENASGLIFTCSAADYSLFSSRHEVVAALGNSMGWYSTLYTAGCLSFEDAFHVVETMGNFQKTNSVGGQLIYPVINERWQIEPKRVDDAFACIDKVCSLGDDHWVGLSIRLGGFLVLAGTDLGIRQLLKILPAQKVGTNEYPFQLNKHAAFHTHLMTDASRHGLTSLNGLVFKQPKIPMIDGRGAIWRPLQADPESLRTYTFASQVREPYDFSAAVRVALREYNPDHLVLLGPGETLGGAIAHVMIAEKWRGISSKEDFIAAQKQKMRPLITMNRADQASSIWI